MLVNHAKPDFDSFPKVPITNRVHLFGASGNPLRASVINFDAPEEKLFRENLGLKPDKLNLISGNTLSKSLE